MHLPRALVLAKIRETSPVFLRLARMQYSRRRPKPPDGEAENVRSNNVGTGMPRRINQCDVLRGHAVDDRAHQFLSTKWEATMSNSDDQYTRYAIYVRTFTDQAGANSNADQVAACIAAAKEINPQMALAEDCIFKDMGSSRVPYLERPGIVALLDRATQQPEAFEHALTPSSDCLSRNFDDALKIIEVLRAHGIVLHFTDLRMSSTDPRFELMLRLSSIMDEQYIVALRTKVRRGLHERAFLEYSTGGQRYGYESYPELSGGRPISMKLRVVESEAEVVRRIYAEYARGVSASEIAWALNRERVPASRSVSSSRRKPSSWTSRLCNSSPVSLSRQGPLGAHEDGTQSGYQPARGTSAVGKRGGMRVKS
jgi:DNA invertase Pin-like site-specific DNA recombinase